MSDAPAPIELPVDRLRAAVRGLWFLGGALLLLGFVYIIQKNVNSELLWKTQPLVFLAGGVFVLIVTTAAFILVFRGAKWIILSLWPKTLGIVISPTAVRLDLGPFGKESYDWKAVHVTLGQGFDPEMLDDLPDDALLPTMTHPSLSEDILSRIQRFAALESEELTTHIRPYLKWYFTGRSTG